MLFRLAKRLRHFLAMLETNIKLILLSSLFVGVWCGVGLNFVTSFLVLVTVYVCTGGWRFLRIGWYTGKRDMSALIVLVKSKWQMRKHRAAKEGIPIIFENTCDKFKNKVCFIDAIENTHMTFGDVDEYSNRIANYFLSQGIKPGDSIGVFMESCPRYACVWLGLSKIGVVPALLNFNLRGQSLAHSLEAANAIGVIYNVELASAIHETDSIFKKDIRKYYVGASGDVISGGISLDLELRSVSSARPPRLQYDFNGPLIYIYTSGTTGLPKAAKVVHSRYFYMAYVISEVCGIDFSSVIYDTLPLYHSAGGILGVGQALLNGSTVVIRKKFSASNFWSDCIKYKCTAAQYIGEICRYLLAQPGKLEDQQHQVKVMFGNGLRPQIWTEFQSRFNVPNIREFYGATEGNASVINMDNTVGCVGFTSAMFPSVHPVSLILVDKSSGLPLRGNDGLCIRAPPGQAGELIGKIKLNDPLYRFDGYSTEAATEKKIARNVFTQGDMYFLTGDILMMDEFGYLYFKDRTGDTFRWKGENVSTSEVEAIVSNLVGMRDAVAYGVEVPGAEGRAGMVAIEDPAGSVDLKQLYLGLSHELPVYARPLFVRLVKEADKTGTYKLKKVELRDEGYNPNGISDRLYFFNSKSSQYEPITPTVYSDIISGKLRF